jgi:hypothetical protein
MKLTMRWILPLLLVVFGSGVCLAQSINAGDIRGTVTDPTGAVIPGVTVSVMNVDTGVSKDFTTNHAGLYDTDSIVPGHYTITFTRDGFEQLVRGPITLEVGFSEISGQLKVGSTKQQVTVTTDIALLTTETGEQATTLDSKTMAELPQVTQDWENFIILLPGAAGTPSVGSANPGQVASINGNLPYSNILADGASTTLPASANANPTTFENVAELQVNTSAFSAQYGIGGVIFNQISKGGTEVWHGTGYDFIQNQILAAAPYEFGNVGLIPPLHYNDFGGAVGGPVLGLKKAFFYFNYDQIVNHGAGSVNKSSVPDTAILGGDFTGLATLYDPTTQTIGTDAQGNLYPIRKSFIDEYGSNAIPTGMQDKVYQGMTQFYPTPTSHLAAGKFLPGSIGTHGEPVQNFVSDQVSSTPYRKYFGRMDYDLTSKNRLTMSDTQSDTPVIYPNSFVACPVGCQSGDVDNNNAQITDVWTITPHVINEVRMGYTWQGNFFADLALGKGLASKVGWQFAKADDFPNIQYADGDWSYAWLEPSSNAVYKEHVFDPSDVVTLIKGRHIMHFGGEFLMFDDNATAWGNTNAGTFQFGSPGSGNNKDYTAHWALSNGVANIDNSTGWAYADYMLGLPASWGASVTPEFGGRLKSEQMFAQDDFKIRPNLTINMGVRYQLTHGWSETHGNVQSFDPTVMNPATGTLGAMWYESTHANGRNSLEAPINNTFLPRVGFSWLLDSKTTFRGGYGLYAYNYSLDSYGGGMGGAFGASGNASDSEGLSPITKLDGQGNLIMPGPVGSTGVGVVGGPLPYTAASTDPARYNGQSVGFELYHTPTPRVNQWNLAVERQFGANFVTSLAYVASHAFDLAFPVNLNEVPQSALLPNKINDAALPYFAAYGEQGVNGNLDVAYTNYNSLQAQITKRMSKGVSFNFNYVWSHFLDVQDSSGWGSREGPQNRQNSYSARANYGPSNFDIRHAFKGMVVYALPFGKGKMLLNNNRALDEIVGGWQVSGTIVLSTGNPFSLAATGASVNNNSGNLYPNRVPGAALYPSHKTIAQWYNPQAFSVPANGTYGNTSRNLLYGPGLEIVNLSAHKEFELLEAWHHDFKFQFRADATNAFNHPSFGVPQGSLANPDPITHIYQGTQNGSGGQINGVTVGGRDLQLGLRLTF